MSFFFINFPPPPPNYLFVFGDLLNPFVLLGFICTVLFLNTSDAIILGVYFSVFIQKLYLTSVFYAVVQGCQQDCCNGHPVGDHGLYGCVGGLYSGSDYFEPWDNPLSPPFCGAASDWPGLCLFFVITLVCFQPVELNFGFFCFIYFPVLLPLIPQVFLRKKFPSSLMPAIG